MRAPERPGLEEDRTDRPDLGLLPTVRDVLHLRDVVAGLPELLAGEESLDAPVRWVHVAETTAAARLLNGGELVLTTGVGWPQDPDALAGHVTELARAGAVGVLLELGQWYGEAPEAMVRRCGELALPFAVLHRQARFVSITEAVHRRIVSEHSIALQAREDARTLFTALGLRGAPADYIVAELASALRCPVVLEDLGHRVLAASGPGVAAALEDWEARSRAARGRAGASGDAAEESLAPRLARPVEARGTRWGRLVALPGPPHPAGRATVLEQGAVALALSRLTDPGDDEWMRLGHRRLVEALTGGSYRDEGSLRSRLEAAGFPVRGRVLSGLVFGGGGPDAAPDVVAAARGLDLAAVAAGGPRGALAVLLSVPAGPPPDATLLARLAGEVARRRGVAPVSLTLACGPAARDLPGLLGSLEAALELYGRPAPGPRPSGPLVLRAEERPLLRLVGALGDDPRLQDHAERMLAPLLEHDAAHDGDLLAVLGVFLAHPGNRTRAANASHLSRSVFYQRLALIERLLGVALDDGETQAALHTALLTRGG